MKLKLRDNRILDVMLSMSTFIEPVPMDIQKFIIRTIVRQQTDDQATSQAQDDFLRELDTLE